MSLRSTEVQFLYVIEIELYILANQGFYMIGKDNLISYYHLKPKIVPEIPLKLWVLLDKVLALQENTGL